MSDHFFANEKCPNPDCEHPMLDHVLEYGCMTGWEWDEQGVAINQGCACPLTLAEDHDPPTEKEWHRANDARNASRGAPGEVPDEVGS